MSLSRKTRVAVVLGVFALAGCDERIGITLPPVDAAVEAVSDLVEGARADASVVDQGVVMADSGLRLDEGVTLDAVARKDGPVDGGTDASDAAVPDLGGPDLLRPRDLATVDLTKPPIDLGCGGKACGVGETCSKDRSCVECGEKVRMGTYGGQIELAPDIATFENGAFVIAYVPAGGLGVGVDFVERAGLLTGGSKSFKEPIQLARVSSKDSFAHLLAIGSGSTWRVSADAKSMFHNEREFNYTSFVPRAIGDVACLANSNGECPAVVGGAYGNNEMKLVNLRSANPSSFEYVWVTASLASAELKEVRLDSDGTTVWIMTNIWNSSTMQHGLSHDELPATGKLSLSPFVKGLSATSGLALGVFKPTSSTTSLGAGYLSSGGVVSFSVGTPFGAALAHYDLGPAAGSPVGVAAMADAFAVLTVEKGVVHIHRVDAAGATPGLPLSASSGAKTPQVAFDAVTGYLAVAWLNVGKLAYTFVHSSCF